MLATAGPGSGAPALQVAPTDTAEPHVPDEQPKGPTAGAEPTSRVGQDKPARPIPAGGAQPQIGAPLTKPVTRTGVTLTKATAILVARPTRTEVHKGATGRGATTKEVENIPAVIATGEARRLMMTQHPDLPEGDPEAVAPLTIPRAGLSHKGLRVLVVVPTSRTPRFGPIELR